ncbi:hypothetical protein HA402_003104 [Bradysia odoriphaga]|nr:hypothetical protein HA402_003104 [Bradysia odoriphaga]
MKAKCILLLLIHLYQAVEVTPYVGQDNAMMMVESPALSQLVNYANTHPNESVSLAETVSGIVYPTLTGSLRVGHRGPVLLSDAFLIEKLQLFNRERIPERVVHSKGAGARGYFQVTNDISQFTKAAFLQPGKRTNVAARFSGATGELGSPDTYFDPRGFAIKFYTEEGNHDLTCINYPIFLMRDAMIFPDITRARKRNPQTHLLDITATVDLISERPEMTLFLLFFLSDMANPKSYRCMKGFAIHAYKMVNCKGEAVYVKFHWTPHEKEEFFTSEEAIAMTAKNPNVLIQDLFDNIAKKNYPKWTLSIQVMTFEQAEKHYQNPFDSTKYWKIEDYPLIRVGEMILNQNPENHFAEVEQIAFSPSNMVRGIEPSPDPLLHARMFAYPDSQLHRLGTNFAQIPINSCPFAKSYHRDGPANSGANGGSAPNYYPNSFNGLKSNDNNKSFKQSVYFVSGDVDRIDDKDDDNFSLPKYHWENHVGPEERKRIIENTVALLRLSARHIQAKILRNVINKINKELGDNVKKALKL